ncbi:MAG: GNAT family N-acetyltransferase [Verrucomicrobiales bacterium]
MRRLTYSEFLKCRDEFAAAVGRSTELSPLCTGPTWQTAAHDSLHGIGPEAAHFIVESEGDWLVFVERDPPRVYFPLESGWLFGSPLVGEPDRLPDLLLKAARDFLPSPVGFCIGGVPAEGRLHRSLRARREFCRQFEEFPTTDCMIVDLDDGFDAWLARRSKRFRRSMKGLPGGESIEIEDGAAGDPSESFERILAIQRRTYKWREGEDIFQDDSYAAFYRGLLEQLHATGELRLLFARRAGADVGYIFGGVAGSDYRGFQMSYVESVRELGVGNALQLENLRRRADESIVRYDLGMHAAYKERWADRRKAFVAVFMVL